VRDKVSHPYSLIGNITVLCMFIFRFFNMRWEDKIFDWIIASIPRI
jgi:hypothetical protein